MRENRTRGSLPEASSVVSSVVSSIVSCFLFFRSFAHQTIFNKEAFKGDSPKLGESLKLGESSRLYPNLEESLKLSPKLGESLGESLFNKKKP